MKSIALPLCLVIAALSPAWAGDTSETVSLRSPSGNVLCFLYADPDFEPNDPIASCELRSIETSSPIPPKPVSCQADYGFRFYVTAKGKAGAACSTGNLEDPESRELGYGENITFHGLTCYSEKNGFTCTNDAGHGFKLSKGEQKLF